MLTWVAAYGAVDRLLTVDRNVRRLSPPHAKPVMHDINNKPDANECKKKTKYKCQI